MALENAEVLSELKERYTTIVEQLNELSNTRVKICLLYTSPSPRDS